MKLAGIKNLAIELAAKYQLELQEVEEEVESALAFVLSEHLGTLVKATFTGDGGIELWRMGDNENDFSTRMIKPKRIKIKGHPGRLINRIRNHIEGGLQTRLAHRDYERFKKLENKIVPGQVARVSKNGDILVEISHNGDSCMGVCPSFQQPPKERLSFIPGMERWFYVLSVTLGNGTCSTHRTNLSRNSKNLISMLIARKLREKGIYMKVKCTSRIAGQMSRIVVENNIPKEIILEMAKEFGERVVVNYGK